MPTVPERNDPNETASVVVELVPRVGRIEADVSHMKVDVSQLKVDVSQLKVDVAGIQATLPHLATKADLATMESRLIRWIAGSWIAMAGVMTAVVTAAVRFAR
jgi:hypothetical protein